MSDYLHECLDRHRDVTRALYGTPQDLREVQRLTAGIVASGRLTYDDVETITQTGLWRGGAFWQWPTRDEFNERCDGQAVDGLSVLPKREKNIVDRLLDIQAAACYASIPSSPESASGHVLRKSGMAT